MNSHRIPNITNTPRLNKAGVIRLGIRENGKPREVGHFIFDIDDPDLSRKAHKIYGEYPRAIDIVFFSDRLEDIFRCTLQRWGKSRKGTPYLLCEGNGLAAVSEGEGKECPCDALRNRECRKTTVIKFLIPNITMAGYFLLATKSEYSAQLIETALKLVQRSTGGIIMRPFTLKRTEGYAEVNAVKTKKYFVSLEAHQAVPNIDSDQVGQIRKQGEHDIASATWLNSEDRELSLKRLQQHRVEKGRAMLKHKVRLIIANKHAETALEEYACKKYNAPSFDDVRVEQLLELWHAMEDDRDVVQKIYTISTGYWKEG